jgi:hypothetical protein
MRNFFILFIFFLPAIAQSQGYSGLWYGRAEANTSLTYNTYLIELNVLKKSTHITGSLNYFFGQNNYKTKVTGAFHPSTKTIELNPFKFISFFAGDKNAPDCEMDGSLTLYVNDGDSVLYGQLNPIHKYRYGCPVMTIRLQKEKPEPIEPDEMLVASDIPIEAVRTILPDSSVPPVIMELNKRQFVEGPLLEVDADSITLHLYDNGKVDQDTVAVFFNRQIVVENMPLSLKPIIIKLALIPGINEVALFAQNLGEIPPNTALCIVYAGTKRYDINLSSSLATNGTIRIIQKE